MIKQDLRSLVRMILLLAETDMQIGMHVALVREAMIRPGLRVRRAQYSIRNSYEYSRIFQHLGARFRCRVRIILTILRAHDSHRKVWLHGYSACLRGSAKDLGPFEQAMVFDACCVLLLTPGLRIYAATGIERVRFVCCVVSSRSYFVLFCI